ncbi:tetratricopeptide repeat protein [Chryseobacterium aureum]|uniref:tetratricopeptide repeat protein n=1 Tax=Chryseobacterium aureum TaxID=2497456 RepID=UPI000F88F923|nr:tetratricopeptide repeat protein [Chryseobacterium aureum]
MTRVFLTALLIILVSCHSQSKKEAEQKFDVSLLRQNEKFRIAGEYDSLINLNKRYYIQADKMNYADGKALCYINLAELNISLENFQKSQILFDNAKEILDHSEDNLHKARFYNVYGRFNVELRRIDKAFQYNNEAMSFIQKSGTSELRNDLLFSIYFRQAIYHIQKKNYEKALEYFHKAKKLDDTGLSDCAIADYVYMHKNKDSAYKYISAAYNKANARGKEDGIALYANTIMGEYYLTYKEYDKAEEALKKALKINEKTKRIYAYYGKYIYNDLRVLYERTGNKEKAYLYLEAYTDAYYKTNSSLLATINQDMEAFITGAQKDADRHKSKIYWIILLSLAGLSLLGLYAWRIIRALGKRKEVLTMEAEDLKIRMNDNKQEEIIELGKKNDPEFLNRFKEAYPEFIDQLLTINPGLENSELVFCAMLKLHFTSKEIANYTLVQHRSVQQKKYRIRKKLNIPSETDIYLFFDTLK